MEMMIMRKLMVIVLMGLIIGGSFGCSAVRYNASRDEIYTNRIMASGDINAIQMVDQGIPARRAIQAIQDPGVYGLAINLSALDVLKQHPWQQLGAAIVDAGIAYGAYLAVDSLGSDGDSSDTSSDSRDTNVAISNSEGSNVIINGDTTTTGDGNE
jgi:hypothetical protein